MIGRRSHDAAQSFEAALGGGAPRDGDTAELVRLAQDICEAATVEPDADFRGTLRTRLMTDAATVLVPLPPADAPRRAPAGSVPASRGGRRRTSLVAAAVAAVGAIGLVGSSASAVPGELLYPVKRSVESVELQLHRGDASRGAFQLERASERLDEARTLSADGRSADLIASTLDDFTAAAAAGSDKLFTAFDSTGRDTTIRTVNDFAATSSADLATLSSQLPADVAPSFDKARNAVTDLAAQAAALCVACVPADVGALVNAVGDLAGKTPVIRPAEPAKTSATATPDKTAAPRATNQPTSQPSAAPTGSTPTTRPTKVPGLPVPTVPTKTPGLTDLTDPLIGGLLGDDTQPGLVPGLVNGLLGTPPAP